MVSATLSLYLYLYLYLCMLQLLLPEHITLAHFGIYHLSPPIHSYIGDKLRILLTKFFKILHVTLLLQDPPEVIERIKRDRQNIKPTKWIE